jgi:RHS repeat-associated protein
VYNDYGYLYQIMRNSQTEPVWKADEMNAVGQFKQITKGNSLVTNFEYDNYHRPGEIKTTGILEYKYDFEKETGNLLSRTDVTGDRKFKERFEYDEGFDRIERGFSKVGSNQEVQKLHMQYYNNGNIDKKSDVGTYQYDPDKLHAVTLITELADDVAIPSAEQTINYTAFRKVQDITEDGKTLVFTYGPDYQRRKTIFDEGNGTTKTKYFMGNYEEEIDSNGNYRKLYYIPGGEALAGVYIVDNSTEQMYYTYSDYLGSILAITNDVGALQQEQRFDAWGRRRNLDDWEYDEISAIDIIDRGYTYHEHLNEFGIVNMNGRLYDPVVGRMLSPDPQLQDPGNTQNYNRYSYVFNNPLKYTDPSGEWIIQALSAIGNAYMAGVVANNWEFNPGKWKLDTKSFLSMTKAAVNGWNSGASLQADIDNLFGSQTYYGPLRHDYIHIPIIEPDYENYMASSDDYYQNEDSEEIKWFPGSEDRPGWKHLGGGLSSPIDVTAERIRNAWIKSVKTGVKQMLFTTTITRLELMSVDETGKHLQGFEDYYRDKASYFSTGTYLLGAIAAKAHWTVGLTISTLNYLGGKVNGDIATRIDHLQNQIDAAFKDGLYVKRVDMTTVSIRHTVSSTSIIIYTYDGKKIGEVAW